MAIKSYKIVADFETTTDPNDVRVWAVCAVDIETSKTLYIDNNIEGFFQWLKKHNTTCYFHNLKFDGEFILSFLLSNGYKYSDSHEAGTFETLITDDGLFYSITVYFARHKKKYQKVVFYDSLKKLPFKVATISEAFALEDSKLKIDYNAYRAPGHILTEEEKEYIIADCRIVAQALKVQFSQELTRMTIASDALHNFKELTSKKYFEKWFPVFPIALDDDLRRAYKGGFTWLNPRYKGVRGIKGVTFDVNSLYPWAMYYSLLPYGFPVYFEGAPEPSEDYPLFIVRLRCRFNIKTNHIPTIQLKNNPSYKATEYLSSSLIVRGNHVIDLPVELTLTNVDLDLFLDHYNVEDLEYIKGWKFKGKTGIFKDYIDYWMHIKETTEGALRTLAKLMLNGLYGKFSSRCKTAKKIPYLDENGIVRYKFSDPEEKDPVYTAMGAFITAYAREKTIRSGQSVYHRFIYADTDSLHLEGWDIPENLEVHRTRLGAWKNEGYFIDSKFIRAKTYMETTIETGNATLENYARALNETHEVWREGEKFTYHHTKVTCAGMTDEIKKQVTYDTFEEGSEFDGKLYPKRCKGGIILTPGPFTIK